MFQTWRTKLREASAALRSGRLDEATRLMTEHRLAEFLPGKHLASQLAQEVGERARRRFADGWSSAGWHDLVAAEQLGGDDRALVTLKQQYIDRVLDESRQYLNGGELPAAVARLQSLERRGVRCATLRRLREAAERMATAQRLCHRGHFARAIEELQAAKALEPSITAIDEVMAACRDRADRLHQWVEKLHAALAATDWTVALTHAEAILDICREHQVAADARRRAWAAVGARVSQSVASMPLRQALRPTRTFVNHPLTDNDTSESHDAASGPRFLLWIDGVGGYLVCQGDVVTLGQPVEGAQVDVPVLADISRQHARIRRDGESYVLEPARETTIGSRALHGATMLVDGSEIELAQSVRMKFHRTHALSRTARLEFVSRHRTSPSTDGVLLLAESCVLGPSSNAHVVCAKWSRDVVLVAEGKQLFCCVEQPYEVDGVAVQGRTAITRASRVVGEDFSFSLETL